ncbi:MAG: hypothetical protein R3E96_10685, partial [Planctomycetota bacterium]
MIALRPLLALASIALVACGPSSSSSVPGAGATPFAVTFINVQPGDTWKVNQPIEITFNADVDFASIGYDSLSVYDTQGMQATGTWGARQLSDGTLLNHILVFQPTCPMQVDGSDAGLAPGGVAYTLRIAGSDVTPLHLRAADGRSLETTTWVPFLTPISPLPSELFHDPVFGSPHLLVRGYLSLPANSPTASHLEALDNPGQPLWFQVPASGPPARLDAVAQAQFPFGLPLNPYGVDAERFDFVLHFDQPILPSAENLAKLRIEHFSGAWIPLPTRALLESNCPDGQTVVRLRTEGMFPRGGTLRFTLRSGFQDIAGHASTLDQPDLLEADCTWLEQGIGAPVDALRWDGDLALPHPFAQQAPASDHPTPAANWTGALQPVFGSDGKSTARSRWMSLGQARLDALGNPLTPAWFFAGTDIDGHVIAPGGWIPTAPADATAVPVMQLEPTQVALNPSDLQSLPAPYRTRPEL